MTPELTIALSDAESYFANRLYADTWDSRSSPDKLKAVSWATAIIGGAFVFGENAYSIENDITIWDTHVVAAVCEQALWCLRADPTEYPALLTLGISEGAAGASAKFDRSFVAPLICETAKALVGELGVLNSESGTIKSYFLGG